MKRLSLLRYQPILLAVCIIGQRRHCCNSEFKDYGRSHSIVEWLIEVTIDIRGRAESPLDHIEVKAISSPRVSIPCYILVILAIAGKPFRFCCHVSTVALGSS